MNVIDEEKLHAVVVDPAITRLNDETIPAIGKVAQDAVSQLHGVIQESLSGATADIQTILGATLVGVQKTVADLDGWTLDIDPITIGPIKLRLSKPSLSALVKSSPLTPEEDMEQHVAALSTAQTGIQPEPPKEQQ